MSETFEILTWVCLFADRNPMRRVVIVPVEHLVEFRSVTWPVVEVDGCPVGQPRRPPTERAGRHYHVVTHRQNSKIETG